MKLRYGFACVSLATSLLVACGGDPNPGPTAPPEPAAPPQPTEPTPTAAPEAPSESPGTPLAVPESGDPANHYLDGETLFTAFAPFQHNFVYASPSKQLAPPGADGKGKFWNFNTKKEIATKHFWRTRAAKPEELAVGPLVLLPHKKGPQGIYVAPDSVKEAYELRWWITRIASVRSMSEGYVLLVANARAAPNALRFLEGDDSPTVRKQGKEDAHYLAGEHWFVGNGPLPDQSFMYLSPAVPAKPDAPFSGGEGRFVLLNDGRIVLTAHAWQTRKANRGELKKDKLVIAPHIKEGGKYRAPKTRAEALTNRWWAVKIEDTKGIGKGTVKVKGGYDVAVDALRVVK